MATSTSSKELIMGVLDEVVLMHRATQGLREMMGDGSLSGDLGTPLLEAVRASIQRRVPDLVKALAPEDVAPLKAVGGKQSAGG